jgi:hypothetical protein
VLKREGHTDLFRAQGSCQLLIHNAFRKAAIRATHCLRACLREAREFASCQAVALHQARAARVTDEVVRLMRDLAIVI